MSSAAWEQEKAAKRLITQSATPATRCRTMRISPPLPAADERVGGNVRSAVALIGQCSARRVDKRSDALRCNPCTASSDSRKLGLRAKAISRRQPTRAVQMLLGTTTAENMRSGEVGEARREGSRQRNVDRAMAAPTRRRAEREGSGLLEGAYKRGDEVAGPDPAALLALQRSREARASAKVIRRHRHGRLKEDLKPPRARYAM